MPRLGQQKLHDEKHSKIVCGDVQKKKKKKKLNIHQISPCCSGWLTEWAGVPCECQTHPCIHLADRPSIHLCHNIKGVSVMLAVVFTQHGNLNSKAMQTHTLTQGKRKPECLRSILLFKGEKALRKVCQL